MGVVLRTRTLRRIKQDKVWNSGITAEIGARFVGAEVGKLSAELFRLLVGLVASPPNISMESEIRKWEDRQRTLAKRFREPSLTRSMWPSCFKYFQSTPATLYFRPSGTR